MMECMNEKPRGAIHSGHFMVSELDEPAETEETDSTFISKDEESATELSDASTTNNQCESPLQGGPSIGSRAERTTAASASSRAVEDDLVELYRDSSPSMVTSRVSSPPVGRTPVSSSIASRYMAVAPYKQAAGAEMLYRKETKSVMIDSSLAKLFACMSLAYKGNQITSPRWKNFKGLRLRLKDKIRLNNIIWRAWHIQYIKNAKPLVCQFSVPIDYEKSHNKPEAIILEGKYWRRKMDAIFQEYKKWRVYFKDKTKSFRPHTFSAVRSTQTPQPQSTDFWSFWDTNASQTGEFHDGMGPSGSGVGGSFEAEDYKMDVSNSLFNSLLSTNTGFEFPNPREISRPGMNADLIQPGLVQLQTTGLDDFIMDTFEPFSELMSTYQGGLLQNVISMPTLPEETMEMMSSSSSGMPGPVQQQQQQQQQMMQSNMGSYMNQQQQQQFSTNDNPMIQPQYHGSTHQSTSSYMNVVSQANYQQTSMSSPQAVSGPSPAQSPVAEATPHYAVQSYNSNVMQVGTISNNVGVVTSNAGQAMRSNAQEFAQTSRRHRKYGVKWQDNMSTPQYGQQQPIQSHRQETIQQTQQEHQQMAGYMSPGSQSQDSAVNSQNQLSNGYQFSHPSQLQQYAPESIASTHQAQQAHYATQLYAQQMPTQYSQSAEKQMVHQQQPQQQQHQAEVDTFSRNSLRKSLPTFLPNQTSVVAPTWTSETQAQNSSLSSSVLASVAAQANPQRSSDFVVPKVPLKGARNRSRSANTIAQQIQQIYSQNAAASSSNSQSPRTASVTHSNSSEKLAHLLKAMARNEQQQIVESTGPIMRGPLERTHSLPPYTVSQRSTAAEIANNQSNTISNAIQQVKSIQNSSNINPLSFNQSSPMQNYSANVLNVDSNSQYASSQQANQRLDANQHQGTIHFVNKNNNNASFNAYSATKQNSTNEPYQSHPPAYSTLNKSPSHPSLYSSPSYNATQVAPTNKETMVDASSVGISSIMGRGMFSLTAQEQQTQQMAQQLMNQVSSIAAMSSGLSGSAALSSVISSLSSAASAAGVSSPSTLASPLSAAARARVRNNSTEQHRRTSQEMKRLLDTSTNSSTSSATGATGVNLNLNFTTPQFPSNIQFTSPTQAASSSSPSSSSLVATRPTSGFNISFNGTSMLESCSPPSGLSAASRKGKSDDELHQYKEHRRVCHINAEQKRRCNIKNGFDTLRSMLPGLSSSSNAKISKASMLHKAGEYIRTLKIDRTAQQQEYDTLREQINELNQSISVFQSQLPATGAPVPCQRTTQVLDFYDDYVRMRTMQNWKFWIFGLLMDTLLDSYNSNVSTNSVDELCKSTLRWVDQSCSLVTLRKDVLNSLTKISTTTNILTSPETLPEEALKFVTEKRAPSSSSSSTIAKDERHLDRYSSFGDHA